MMKEKVRKAKRLGFSEGLNLIYNMVGFPFDATFHTDERGVELVRFAGSRYGKPRFDDDPDDEGDEAVEPLEWNDRMQDRFKRVKPFYVG